MLATSSSTGFGGKGANQAAAAAALGAVTHLVAKVGDDADGRRAVRELRDASVGIDTVISERSALTGRAVVMVDPSGENSIVVVPGANALLGAAEVASTLRRLRPGVDDVILTSGEIPQACLGAAADVLPLDTRWVHNVAPATTLLPKTGHRRLLVVNALEARQLTSASTVTEAAEALAEHGSAAVVTLGGDGALVAEAGHTTHLPAPSVTVVDTTGAGDVFCGALAAELARGSSLISAVTTATAAGAFAVTRPGARGALPRRRDLERFLAH